MSDKEDQKKKKEEADKKQISFGKLAAVGVLGGILALGTPFLIGVFAIALAVGIVALGKKIYDYNHKKLANELNESGKKLNKGEKSKDDDKIKDLANSKNLDELNKKLSKSISDFAKTKAGQALINNEKFQGMVKDACGVELKDIVQACEKNDLLSISKDKEPYVPAKDVTEDFKDILEEAEREENLEKKGIKDARNLEDTPKESEMEEMKDIEPEEKNDEPELEEPKPDEPLPDKSEVEEPKTDEPELEEPKPDESLKEEPKVDDKKPDEVKAEEPKKDDKKQEESKTDEPELEEPKPDEPLPGDNSDTEPDNTQPEAPEAPEAPETPSGDGVGSKIASGLATAAKTAAKAATTAAKTVAKAAKDSTKDKKSTPSNSNNKKDNKGEEKDEEKDKEKGLTAGQLKNMFKIFVVGMFLFGAPLTKDVVAEVVFTTAMVGYTETLTDPSYYGQMVVQTFPLIGNYGVNQADFESDGIHMSAYITREYCKVPSNFRCKMDLDTFLKKEGIPGIYDIDTRFLTKLIRENGVMNGRLTLTKPEASEADSLKSFVVSEAVSSVTCKKSYYLPSGLPKRHVVVWDFGAKQNIIKKLHSLNCNLTVVPSTTTCEEILALNPDGIMLSNGPGNPKENNGRFARIKYLVRLGAVDIKGFALMDGITLLTINQG